MYTVSGSFKTASVDNDRLYGVQLISDIELPLTIVGVYLPYYKGTSEQIKRYSDILDILQSILDTM